MTKAKMTELAQKYGMTLHRHPVTQQITNYALTSAELIPELDAYADSDQWDRVGVTREIIDGENYQYKIFIPAGWVDMHTISE